MTRPGMRESGEKGMDNGDRILVFIATTAQLLAGKTVLGYYREPLPSSMDRELSDLIARFTRFDQARRETFLRSLPDGTRSLFGIFGHRAATLSVRESSPDWLRNGLIGAVIANYLVPDKRKVEVSLAVYHHCARQLGINTVDLFEEVASYATPSFADTLIRFGRRSDVTLKKFGWRERQTPEGVKYTFSWG